MNNNPYDMQSELRYGYPSCDQLLVGRDFTIGYSDYFRQAKWVLELVSKSEHVITQTEREDIFRPDSRINKRFRASLAAYVGSGWDRGHLVPSANKLDRPIQNSETFLLSNISPQDPDFNRKIWRILEKFVRTLDEREDILETYVLTAPVFDFGRTIETIGTDDDFGIDIPIPHYFVKSILAEDNRGRFKLISFEMENKELGGDILDYLVNTYDVEQRVGGRFWTRVYGPDIHDQKETPDYNIGYWRKLSMIWVRQSDTNADPVANVACRT